MTYLEIISSVLQNAQKPMTAKEICEVAQAVTGEPIGNQANVNVTAGNNSDIIYQYKAEQEKNKPTKFWLYSELEIIVLQVIRNQLTGKGNRGKTEKEIKEAITETLVRIDSSLSQLPDTLETVFQLFESLCDTGKEIDVDPKRPYLTFNGTKYKLIPETKKKSLLTMTVPQSMKHLLKQ